MQKKMGLLCFLVLILAGCATSTGYINYTDQRFPPKDQYYTENIYLQTQPFTAKTPYYIIGKVLVEGYASSGVSPETLNIQAKEIARKKGADAIINANTVAYRYFNGDALLRFRGELIVFAPATPK